MNTSTGQSDDQSIEQLTETVMMTAKAMADICDMIAAKDLKRQRNEPEKIIRYIDDFSKIGFMQDMGRLADLVIATNEAHMSISNVSTYLKLNPNLDHEKLKRKLSIIKYAINKKIEEYDDYDADLVAQTRVITQKN